MNWLANWLHNRGRVYQIFSWNKRIVDGEVLCIDIEFVTNSPSLFSLILLELEQFTPMMFQLKIIGLQISIYFSEFEVA